MQVTPYDRLRFLVESESGQQKYLVDLCSHNGLGRCYCKDFSCRVEPEIKKGGLKRHRMCKHLHAAREFFTNRCIRQIMQEYPDWKDAE